MKDEGLGKLERAAAKIGKLPDANMRAVKIVELISSVSAASAALLIQRVVEGSLAGSLGFKSAHMALLRNRDFSKALGYERVREIYGYARENSLFYAVSILRNSTPVKSVSAEKEIERSHLASKLKHLTLGEKKAYARRRNFKHLEFLLYDTNPSVINNLLQNPRITEREVVKIAANKSSPRQVLAEIFMSNRWISRYRVRKALVFNENTPLDIALNLCPFLMKQDIKLIVKDGKLNVVIVERAAELLKDWD